MSVATGHAADLTYWRNAVVAAYAFSGIAFLVNPLAVAAGLAVIGLGTASWNTASNVEAVERAVGRHIMPRLHGAFSLGKVAGSAAAAS